MTVDVNVLVDDRAGLAGIFSAKFSSDQSFGETRRQSILERREDEADPITIEDLSPCEQLLLFSDFEMRVGVLLLYVQRNISFVTGLAKLSHNRHNV